MTGEGMDELFEAVQEAREEYLNDYKPQLDAVVAERVRPPFLPPHPLVTSMLSARRTWLTGEEEEYGKR